MATAILVAPRRRLGPSFGKNVAERLSRQSRVPVIMVRAPEAFEAWLRGERPLRVMVGSDLGAASLTGDPFFFHVSMAGFLRYLAAALFMANRRFEPSNRQIDVAVRTLPKLPDQFEARWTSLLRYDAGSTPERAFGIAQLLAGLLTHLKH